MMQVIASSVIGFFPGDFILFGTLGALVWYLKSKEDEDFYG
jgi:hypothetical protein